MPVPAPPKPKPKPAPPKPEPVVVTPEPEPVVVAPEPEPEPEPEPPAPDLSPSPEVIAMEKALREEAIASKGKFSEKLLNKYPYYAEAYVRDYVKKMCIRDSIKLFQKGGKVRLAELHVYKANAVRNMALQS